MRKACFQVMPKACFQHDPCHRPSPRRSNAEVLAPKGAAYIRRPVSPPSPLAHAQFLPDSCSPQVSAPNNRTRVPTRQPRSRCRLQEAPSQGPPRRPRGLQGLTARGLPSGTRARRFSSLSALRDPPLTRRSTRRDHRGTPYSLYRGRRGNARHCCSTPDGDRTGPPGSRPPNDGLLPGAGRCRARCWIQTPRLGSDNRRIGARQPRGDKSNRPKIASRLTRPVIPEFAQRISGTQGPKRAPALSLPALGLACARTCSACSEGRRAAERHRCGRALRQAQRGGGPIVCWPRNASRTVIPGHVRPRPAALDPIESDQARRAGGLPADGVPWD